MGEAFRPTLVPPPSSAPVRFDLTKKQLDLVWDMNRDLNPREFDQFIETARALGLSPLSRQICAIVFNKSERARRQMVIVTTIAGLRAIADRSDTYRPDDQPARIVYDEAARHPKANPHGIVEGIVTPFRFAHGAWHPVVGQVFWDEIAPIREKGGERWLDSRTPWPARPRGQFIKCCEAAALRLGWPENLANVYAEDEVDRARMIDITPSEAAEQAKKERLELVQPAGTIIVDIWDGKGLRPSRKANSTTLSPASSTITGARILVSSSTGRSSRRLHCAPSSVWTRPPASTSPGSSRSCARRKKAEEDRDANCS